ncbi:MAG: hypothetical protein LBV30_10990 [Propionibacteriaceae bacterium]|jgi:hypothetical protein|nr:hypothetical protein [Propionibacteriaceae bacterium]
MVQMTSDEQLDSNLATMPTGAAPAQVTVDFAGEIVTVDPSVGLTIGREADLVLDADNPFLHRVFLRIAYEQGIWWLRNIGSNLKVTVSANLGEMQAWLSPAGQLALVFPLVTVWFTAGDMTYELEIRQDQAPWESVPIGVSDAGDKTIGSLSLTVEQRLLVTALAEDVLRHQRRGAGLVPSSTDAAARLGWSVTKFNRKLDYLCAKLADIGVRGLHGGPGHLATSRKARLVEYCLGCQMITIDDIALLPRRHRPASSQPAAAGSAR